MIDLSAPNIDVQIRDLIDKGLKDLSGRTLVSAEEVSDLLLDLRHLTGRHAEFAQRLFSLWRSAIEKTIVPEWTSVHKGWVVLPLNNKSELIGRYDGSGVWTVWRDEFDAPAPELLGEFTKFEMREMASSKFDRAA